MPLGTSTDTPTTIPPAPGTGLNPLLSTKIANATTSCYRQRCLRIHYDSAERKKLIKW
jgi:hypothetical protein